MVKLCDVCNVAICTSTYIYTYPMRVYSVSDSHIRIVHYMEVWYACYAYMEYWAPDNKRLFRNIMQTSDVLRDAHHRTTVAQPNEEELAGLGTKHTRTCLFSPTFLSYLMTFHHG